MKWIFGEKTYLMLTQSLMSWLGLSAETFERLLNTILIFLAYLLLTRASRFLLRRQVDDAARRYSLAKMLNYSLTLLALLVVVKIWLQEHVNLATYLGIVSAGLAIALQAPIVDMAAWLFLIIRQPFRVGDRIQIGDLRGDVIDIRLYMFTVLEIGNWVDAEQSTGRVVHVPNGLIFKETLANYTQGFEFVWNEIPVTITFESNWKKARKLLKKIADEQVDKLDKDMKQQLRELDDKWRIVFHHLTPIVWLKVVDSGVTLTIRHLVKVRQRRSTEERLWLSVLDAFGQEDDIDLAYPTQRVFLNPQEGKPGSGGPQSRN